MVKTVADTIVWMAEERVKAGGYKNLVSAMHAVLMEVGLLVGKRMATVSHQGTKPQRKP